MNSPHLDTAHPERTSFTDLTGDTFGLLRVERYAGSRITSYFWHWRCECGEDNQRPVPLSAVVHVVHCVIAFQTP